MIAVSPLGRDDPHGRARADHQHRREPARLRHLRPGPPVARWAPGDGAPRGGGRARPALRAGPPRTCPERLWETAYALACDVAAADGRITEPEGRMLEEIREELADRPPPRRRHRARRAGALPDRLTRALQPRPLPPRPARATCAPGQIAEFMAKVRRTTPSTSTNTTSPWLPGWDRCRGASRQSARLNGQTYQDRITTRNGTQVIVGGYDFAVDLRTDVVTSGTVTGLIRPLTSDRANVGGFRASAR